MKKKNTDPNVTSYLPVQIFDDETQSYREHKAEWADEEGVREYLHSKWHQEYVDKFEHSTCETKAEKEMPDEERYSLDRKTNLRVQSLSAILEGGGEGHLPTVRDFAEEKAEEEDHRIKLELLHQLIAEFDEQEAQLFRHFFCGEAMEVTRKNLPRPGSAH